MSSEKQRPPNVVLYVDPSVSLGRQDRETHESKGVSDHTEAVRVLIRSVHRLTLSAYNDGNDHRIVELAGLLKAIGEMGELTKAYEKSDGQIGGEEGVAKYLGITRTGVYTRLKALGLTANELQPSVNTMKLLMQSSRFAPLLRDVLLTADSTQ